MKKRIHDCCTTGICEYLTSKPDQATCGDMKLQPDTARAMVDHLDHLALPAPKLLNHNAEKRFGTIDDQQFERLLQLSIDGLGEDFRFPNHQLVAFAPHGFNENRQLQFTTTHH